MIDRSVCTGGSVWTEMNSLPIDRDAATANVTKHEQRNITAYYPTHESIKCLSARLSIVA